MYPRDNNNNNEKFPGQQHYQMTNPRGNNRPPQAVIREGLSVQELKAMTALRMQSQGGSSDTSQYGRSVSSTYDTATPQQLAAAGIQPVVINDRRNQTYKSHDVHYQQQRQVPSNSYQIPQQQRQYGNNQYNNNYHPTGGKYSQAANSPYMSEASNAYNLNELTQRPDPNRSRRAPVSDPYGRPFASTVPLTSNDKIHRPLTSNTHHISPFNPYSQQFSASRTGPPPSTMSINASTRSLMEGSVRSSGNRDIRNFANKHVQNFHQTTDVLDLIDQSEIESELNDFLYHPPMSSNVRLTSDILNNQQQPQRLQQQQHPLFNSQSQPSSSRVLSQQQQQQQQYATQELDFNTNFNMPISISTSDAIPLTNVSRTTPPSLIDMRLRKNPIEVSSSSQESLLLTGDEDGLGKFSKLFISSSSGPNPGPVVETTTSTIIIDNLTQKEQQQQQTIEQRTIPPKLGSIPKSKSDLLPISSNTTTTLSPITPPPGLFKRQQQQAYLEGASKFTNLPGLGTNNGTGNGSPSLEKNNPSPNDPDKKRKDSDSSSSLGSLNMSGAVFPMIKSKSSKSLRLSPINNNSNSPAGSKKILTIPTDLDIRAGDVAEFVLMGSNNSTPNSSSKQNFFNSPPVKISKTNSFYERSCSTLGFDGDGNETDDSNISDGEENLKTPVSRRNSTTDSWQHQTIDRY